MFKTIKRNKMSTPSNQSMGILEDHRRGKVVQTQEIYANGNYTNACIPLYLEANALDCYQLQVYTTDGTDATFLNAIFTLTYLHN